jgi:primosomal protein N' (replication factor Y)
LSFAWCDFQWENGDLHQVDRELPGKQVLYLLPEIALTTQLVGRLKLFWNRVAVFHSKYSSNERVEVWKQVLKF